MEYWKFTEIARTEELSFHNVLERFHKNKISGLIRESIQNSLDGKNYDNDAPVIVTIKTGDTPVDSLPGISEIHNRIMVLKGGNSYAKENITFMQKSISGKTTSYISIEDSNTKGLDGVEPLDKKGTFYSYAYNKGVHVVEADSEKEKLRGGSHGIGKIAFNAASDINIMFFSNCDQNGNQHICGSAQLIEHEYKGKCYRATGYFTDEIEHEFKPYRNKFDDIFIKNTRGLKIVVPYLRETYQDSNELVRSVCGSFFLAIKKGDLVVDFNGNTIDSSTIEDLIFTSGLYELNPSEINKDFTPLYFQTLLDGETRNIDVEDLREKYNFKLVFTYDEEIKNGRTAIVRTVGMKIEDFKVKGKVRKPYNAVLIPISSKEDAFLKSLENESHTELSYEHIKDPDQLKNAKRFISNLNTSIGKVIDEYINKNNPVDGKIDTSDIIYDIENKFKNALEKNTSVVRVNVGNKKKMLVKSGKEVRDQKKKENKQRNDPKDKSRRAKNLGDDSKKPIYSVDPSIIKRIHSGSKEIIRMDFRKNPELSNLKRCNLQYWYIDGMGKENVIDYDLRNQIKAANAVPSNRSIDIKEKALKNIPVYDGILEIRLSLNENYNSAIKYAYYLEVKE